jgi:hypothetical protein
VGRLPDSWRCIVIAALQRLRSGDDRGFEDALWLGVGDAWWPLRNALVRKGLIELSADGVHPRLTSRGRSYLDQIREPVAS